MNTHIKETVAAEVSAVKQVPRALGGLCGLCCDIFITFSTLAREIKVKLSMSIGVEISPSECKDDF